MWQPGLLQALPWLSVAPTVSGNSVVKNSSSESRPNATNASCRNVNEPKRAGGGESHHMNRKRPTLDLPDASDMPPGRTKRDWGVALH